MLYGTPSPAQLKKARVKTIEKELKTMLEEEFLQRRTFHDTYSPYMCEKLLQVGEKGGGRSEMMQAINVRTRTAFFKWLEENPEFQDAYELAQVYCQAFLEKKLLEGSLGQIDKFNPKALQLLMASRFPEYRTETKTEINIGSLTSVQKLDSTSLDEKIKALTQKLGLSSPDTIDAECTVVEND